MKKQLLSAAIAVASMAGFSSQAFAYTLADNGTPDVELFISGASAQDKGIESLVKSFCDGYVSDAAPGTLNVFKDGATGTGKLHSAWYCLMTPAKVPSLTGNKKVLIHKRADGGSAQGVSPLLANTNVTHMGIANCTGTGLTRNCDLSLSGNTITNKKSDLGVSDVNPELFAGPLNTPIGPGLTPVAAADVALKLEVKPAAALVFGLTVNQDLYVALQQAQGLIDGGCAADDRSDACMPTLNKSQIASLMTGGIKSWDQLNINGAALTAAAGVTAPDDTLVHICKRTAGSGTGAQAYAKFLNNPCTAGAATIPGSDSFVGPVIHDNKESGDLEACQTAFNTGSLSSTALDANGDALNPDGLTAWNIGVQSLEKNNNGTLNYRFVKVDGVAPTLANVYNGSYYDWVELTYQYRKSTQADSPAGDANKMALINKIIAEAGKPATLNGTFNKTHAFGKSGYLAVPANGFACGTSLVETAPVVPWTHAAGGSLNNCTVPSRSPACQ